MSGDRLRSSMAELVAIIERHGSAGIDDFDVPYVAAAMTRARALLAEAQPQPVEPTDEELRLLSDDFTSYGDDCRCLFDEDAVEFARAVLQRWGRPVPEPVSVAERLPTAQDCNADGRCWVHQPNTVTPETPDWTLMASHYARANYGATHWLPHWALPVPQEQADG